MQRNHSPEVLKAVCQCYNSKPINELLSKLDPPSVIDDLKQEMFCYLLERDERKLAGLVERGELQAFMLFIIKRNITSTKSKFYRLQRKETGVEIPTTYAGFIDLEDSGQIAKEQMEQDAEAERRFGAAFVEYVYQQMARERTETKQPEQLGLFSV